MPADQTEPASLLTAAFAAVILALAHVGTPYLRFLHGTPRSAWLSAAGGVAVAYVFVHLLPELAEGQQHLTGALNSGSGMDDGGSIGTAGLRMAERHVYVVALAGLALFYGLERLANLSRAGTSTAVRDTGGAGDDGSEHGAPHEATSPGVFWVHMAFFSLYNALVGYLLVWGEHETTAVLALFTTAFAFHFVVTDFGLYVHHRARYHDVGRWLLGAAVFAGFGAASATRLPDEALAVLLAFLAGGVILNVIKEEVPNERQSRFWAFAAGLIAYTALLLTL